MNAMSVVPRFLRRSWDTVGLAAMILAFLLATLPLSPVAAWIPRIVLALTLVPVAVQLVIEFRELTSGATSIRGPVPPVVIARVDADSTAPAPGTPLRRAALWLTGLLVAVLTLGTSVGSALFCFAYLRCHARDSWSASGIAALLLGATIHFVFGGLMQASLYQGWLGSLVR